MEIRARPGCPVACPHPSAAGPGSAAAWSRASAAMQPSSHREASGGCDGFLQKPRELRKGPGHNCLNDAGSWLRLAGPDMLHVKPTSTLGSLWSRGARHNKSPFKAKLGIAAAQQTHLAYALGAEKPAPFLAPAEISFLLPPSASDGCIINARDILISVTRSLAVASRESTAETAAWEFLSLLCTAVICRAMRARIVTEVKEQRRFRVGRGGEDRPVPQRQLCKVTATVSWKLNPRGHEHGSSLQ